MEKVTKNMAASNYKCYMVVWDEKFLSSMKTKHGKNDQKYKCKQCQRPVNSTEPQIFLRYFKFQCKVNGKTVISNLLRWNRHKISTVK